MIMRTECIVEKYEKYADDTWHLRETERLSQYGINLHLRNGKFYDGYNGEREININTDPNNPNCGYYYKVVDIVREENCAITDKVLCEFTAYYPKPVTYIIGVLVYRNSMPKYFCHPKAIPSSRCGYNVSDVEFTEDIMKLRRWLIRKFKGNMYFDEKNRKAFADLL